MDRGNESVDPAGRTRRAPGWPPVLPDVIVGLDGAEIRRRMEVASRRGRVPGVHLREGETLFEVDGCGTPFEHHLVARGVEGASGTRVVFTLRRRMRVPLIFAALIVVSIWPGVYFMDQLIPGEWGWIPTWTWYMPLMVVSAPWMWVSSVRKSRAIATEDAASLVERVRVELGGGSGVDSDGAPRGPVGGA